MSGEHEDSAQSSDFPSIGGMYNGGKGGKVVREQREGSCRSGRGIYKL